MILSAFTRERQQLSGARRDQISCLPTSSFYRFSQGLLKADFLAKESFIKTYRLEAVILYAEAISQERAGRRLKTAATATFFAPRMLYEPKVA